MSTALLKTESMSLALPDIMTLGDVFKNSGYFRDVRDQAQAVVKILYGKELGFSPVVSMMGIHVIEGKPALSSNLMGAMVKRSGKYDYRVKMLTETECVLEFFQEGKSSGSSAFTIQDAQRAGVVRMGSGWTKYPRNMLFARALSNGVKLYCPELSACPMYVPEELGAEVNEEGEVTELPKSARPVEVLKEAVTFRKPAPVGQEQNSGQIAPDVRSDAGVATPVPGTAKPRRTRKAAPQPMEAVSPELDNIADDNPTPLTDEELRIMNKLEVAAEEPPSGPYIDPNQQVNFHFECRKAVRREKYHEADVLTYQWLKDNKFVNDKGEPTAAKIPASGWLTLRHQATTWLKAQ